MKHVRENTKMGLLGENHFPPLNDTHLSNRRHFALQQLFGAIVKNKPSVIYICPTKGVNINILPLIMINNIKFILVIPSKKFFTLLNKEEKSILDAASSSADKILILDTEDASPIDWSSHLIEGTRKVIESSDWVMIAHNQYQENEAFADLMLNFEGDPTPILEVGIGQEG